MMVKLNDTVITQIAVSRFLRTEYQACFAEFEVGDRLATELGTMASLTLPRQVLDAMRLVLYMLVLLVDFRIGIS